MIKELTANQVVIYEEWFRDNSIRIENIVYNRFHPIWKHGKDHMNWLPSLHPLFQEFYLDFNDNILDSKLIYHIVIKNGKYYITSDIKELCDYLDIPYPFPFYYALPEEYKQQLQDAEQELYQINNWQLSSRCPKCGQLMNFNYCIFYYYEVYSCIDKECNGVLKAIVNNDFY